MAEKRYVIRKGDERMYLKKVSAWTGGETWEWTSNVREAWHFERDDHADAWAKSYGAAGTVLAAEQHKSSDGGG